MGSPTLGIVGGLGPESTVVYYRSILAEYRQRHGDGSPPIIINSLDVTRALALVGSADFPQLIAYFLEGIHALHRAGTSVGLIAANTPHIVFNEVALESPIPLISIVEANADAAASAGMSRVALLGTRFTMQAGFYREVFGTRGITVVRCSEDDEDKVHEKYTSELLRNVFLPATHDYFCELIERLRTRELVDGVILGGTELSLILTESTVAGIPLIDTTAIHARAAVMRLWP